MRSFIRLLIAIALVMGAAHLMRQAGVFVDLKQWAEPQSFTHGTAVGLQRYANKTRPIVLGDHWFLGQIRARCPEADAAYIKVHQSYFSELAAVVEQIGFRTRAPVVMQIGNRTWFPNRGNTKIRLDYLPAHDPLSVGEIWMSTELLFQLPADLLRRDPKEKPLPKGDYLLAAADLNGLSGLLKVERALPNDFYMIAADEKPLKGITGRQRSRRDRAIVQHRNARTFQGLDEFVDDTGCAPLSKEPSSQ